MSRTKIIGLLSVTVFVVGAVFFAPSPVLAAETNAPVAVKPADFTRTGWNARVRQVFMYPPLFQYTPVEGAAQYRFTVKGTNGPAINGEMSGKPEIDLAKGWSSLPEVGPFAVLVEAVDVQGKVLAKVVSECRRKAPFKGPYRPAKCGYAESGAKAVGWELAGAKGAGADSYPTITPASYIGLLTAYARTTPQGGLAQKAVEKAEKLGYGMLRGRAPADWVYGDIPQSHSLTVLQVSRAAMAGKAFLNLYDVTQDKMWLDAASRIAETLKKTQSVEGAWPYRVEPRSGMVWEDYTSDQAQAALLFDELILKHGKKKFEPARDKAVRWMLDNPCQTYLWQQEWDDVGLYPPYQRLEHYDTALLIEYLLRYATAENKYEQKALELSHYIEDQFVEWEPVAGSKEITPGVREQYGYDLIIDWHNAHYIRVCMAFHARTKDEVWLKKARALADTLTAVQHPTGYYPTYVARKAAPPKDDPNSLEDITYGGVWANCTAYTGEMLLRLDEYLNPRAASSTLVVRTPTATPSVSEMPKSPELKRTGWNAQVRQRFIHPPVLQYAPLEGAVNYRLAIGWTNTPGGVKLASAKPEFDLAKTWENLPVAVPLTVAVEAVDPHGKVLAKATQDCFRKAPFKGSYRQAKRGYAESGLKAVDWLISRKPNPQQDGYPVPRLSSSIRLLTTYARTNPRGELVQKVLAQVEQHGPALLTDNTPSDYAWPNMPLSQVGAPYIQVHRCALGGLAYLDLYAATTNTTWLEAATLIAETLRKRQLPDGRWKWRVDPKYDMGWQDHTSDQVEEILLFDELIRRHGKKVFEPARDKAVQWMLENPCKNYLWQHQWEDCQVAMPYTNLEWYDAGLFVEYLLRNATPQNAYERIAGELMRYIEDQFVEWEPVKDSEKMLTSNHWQVHLGCPSHYGPVKAGQDPITPGVRQQQGCAGLRAEWRGEPWRKEYGLDQATDWDSAHYIRVCLAFHAKTKDDVWLKKARAMADTLTAVQHPNGYYPSRMHYTVSKDKTPELDGNASAGEGKSVDYDRIWPNNTAYAAEMLIRLGEYIQSIEAKSAR